MVPLLLSTFLVEKKEYEADSSVEEIDAILSRLYVLEKEIIIYKELPMMSTFSTNLLFDKLEEMIKDMENPFVLFDLSETRAPGFELRQLLYRRFEPITPLVNLFSFTTGKNGLINIALKFFMNTTKSPVKNSSVSSTYEEALKKIYDKVG